MKALKSYGIKRVCALFEVSESAYYAQLRQGSKPNKYGRLSLEIKALFDESLGSAGKRTLKARLQHKGIEVGLALIRKLMKQQGLESKQPKKRYSYPFAEGQTMPFNHLLNRQFTPDSQTTVLCGDTTYLKVNGEWHYLAVVLNLAHRQVVGWRLQREHNADLVVEALNHAMLTTARTKEMIFHSDQGSVYRNYPFTQCVKRHGLIQSMSRRGNCWDNAPMERWFRRFKYEWMLKEGYDSLSAAKEDIKNYVFYYNTVRPHAYNQGLPPVLAKQPIRDC
ncbi:IS3 family transposase [Gallibacterium salpingitidis]|uniref:IS3 family transposase n=1 Tax=Gallibacterium salpingitidis TaxID=505341 RepID=UPI00266F6DB0|nr:IS3 family transposase [Gallibacterium salpingitidis]WKT01086.1 IS3 family transposase [Gallibacterium salpingitidis]